MGGLSIWHWLIVLPDPDVPSGQSSAQLGGKTIEGEVTKETSTKV